MFNPLDLSGKLILVTGASSGIGRATAVVLSKLGASVILSGRREAELQATMQMMDGSGRHSMDPFDLTDIDAIPSWVQRLSSNRASGLHGVVHSAGIGSTYPIRLLNRAKIDEIMGPNVYAALTLLRALAMKGIAHQDGCSAVLVSSISGLIGGAGKTVYGASKAALHSIAKSAAIELTGKKIRVNCVAPAWVDTPLLQRALVELPDSVPELRSRQLLGPIPAEDVGVAIAYLLSDFAKYVTGTTLMVNGGYDY